MGKFNYYWGEGANLVLRDLTWTNRFNYLDGWLSDESTDLKKWALVEPSSSTCH